MIISVPLVALGTQSEVLSRMKKWCRNPSEAAPLTDVETKDIVIQRFRTPIDFSQKKHVRLSLFSDALTGCSFGPDRIVRIVNEVIDANHQTWRIPYLFEYFAVPVLLPVRQRLVDICHRHWSYIYSLGPVFTDNTDCMAGAPLNGAVPPEEPLRWLEATSRSNS